MSYAGAGGARAVEHLRAILQNVMVATVHAQVMLSLFTDFDNFTTFQPNPRHDRKCIRCSIEVSAGADHFDRSEHHWLSKQCVSSHGTRS